MTPTPTAKPHPPRLQREIVHATTPAAVEAWQRLGWTIIGHAWDSAGPYVILSHRRA